MCGILSQLLQNYKIMIWASVNKFEQNCIAPKIVSADTAMKTYKYMKTIVSWLKNKRQT